MTNAEFISKVTEIAAEHPEYQLGHDGSDGKCDCVGLIIGAVRRAGGRWTGTHGSNYAARSMTAGLRKIVSDAELSIGDLVYKAREPGEKLYNLPTKYQQGGASYTGDLLDYYHIGVVTGVYPIRITHMTTPTSHVDTKLGKWAYFGKLKLIDGAPSGGEEKKAMEGTYKVGGGNLDLPINMRAAGSSGSNLVAQIPQGAEVQVISWSAVWTEISYRGAHGYIKTEFLQMGTEENITVTLTAEEARAFLPILDKVAEQLASTVGRG